MHEICAFFKFMPRFSIKIHVLIFFSIYFLTTAELLGFNNYIPSFATAKGRKILSGVNYASGSAGILNETGQHLVINPLTFNICKCS